MPTTGLQQWSHQHNSRGQNPTPSALLFKFGSMQLGGLAEQVKRLAAKEQRCNLEWQGFGEHSSGSTGLCRLQWYEIGSMLVWAACLYWTHSVVVRVIAVLELVIGGGSVNQRICNWFVSCAFQLPCSRQGRSRAWPYCIQVNGQQILGWWWHCNGSTVTLGN